MRVWTKQERMILRRGYPSHTAEEMATRLGRSYHAVRVQAARLGLRRVRNFHRPGPPPTCVCGICKLCKNRVRRHRWRARVKRGLA
jgi:hypothetical protein